MVGVGVVAGSGGGGMTRTMAYANGVAEVVGVLILCSAAVAAVYELTRKSR